MPKNEIRNGGPNFPISHKAREGPGSKNLGNKKMLTFRHVFGKMNKKNYHKKESLSASPISTICKSIYLHLIFSEIPKFSIVEPTKMRKLPNLKRSYHGNL